MFLNKKEDVNDALNKLRESQKLDDTYIESIRRKVG